MDSFVGDLIGISHYAAQHPRLVQGGGGNCSVKCGRMMAVKSSGIFLEEMNSSSGYCLIDLTSGSVSGPSTRPSLEAPLHKLLGRYVIHTHPIALGPFVCSEEGEKELARLFPENDHIWVPYADPGRAIFSAMEKIIEEQKLDVQSGVVLFLQNHGLFVSAPDKQTCLLLHEETVSRLEGSLGLKEYPEPAGSARVSSGFLTPDHAVYSNLGPENSLSGKQKTAARELYAFTASVLGLIEKMKWTPRFLSAETAGRLLNMEEEKHRQEILRRENP